jgi:CBS domain containing-hemolysin-like protein
LDKPPKPRNKKSFQVAKPDQNVAVSHKWTVIVILTSFFLSIIFSAVTSSMLEQLNISWAFVILFMIVFLNVLFDVVGTAVISAQEAPFHSLAARRVRGARESVSIIRHAPQVSNLCNDVIGDIAGIISGAAVALIIAELVATFGFTSMIPSLALTGLVSAMTIGGKAFCKGLAMKNCNSIVFFIGKLIGIVNLLLHPFRNIKKLNSGDR